ncbi:MAG: nitroreductase family protein [Dehalococcoidia bacterium]
MEVLQCLKERVTVREFTADPVPGEMVDKLLQVGRLAPSSRNQQPWHFIVIRDRKTLKQLGEIAATGSFLARAPIAIAIAMENADSPALDAGRALQQMEVLAWSEGLGTCFVTLQSTEEVQAAKQLLNMPEEMELITVLPFGYRRQDQRKGKHRKPLSRIVHSERFGQEYLASKL